MESLHKTQTNNVNNGKIRSLMKPEYSLEEIQFMAAFLESQGTFEFPALPTGLFPAAALGDEKDYSGYSSVWVRDNVYVAFSHYFCGDHLIAVRAVNALMTHFKRQRHRFMDITELRVDPQNPMIRPHIRFDGNSFEAYAQEWPHAQNDALGYFVWLYCQLAGDSHLNLLPDLDDFEALNLFVRFFHAIQYWEDEDSGHWEETRKVNASSIGAVLAGLRELKNFISKSRSGSYPRVIGKIIDHDLVDQLMARGSSALGRILPHECTQPDSKKRRDVDAALLFLIYPLQVIQDRVAERVLQNVVSALRGDFGIRRYLGDSYWAPDYKGKLPPEARSANYSRDLSLRDSLLPAIGMEAQWCIFDPIISCIFGSQFQRRGQRSDFDQQTHYLNRALGQITGESLDQEVPPFRCPELYYLRHGQYSPNDHVPLLWTQANLRVALKIMEQSCHLLHS